MSFAVLGRAVFEASADKVFTWQDARRQRSARWHQHETIGTKPKQEFLGPNLDTLELGIMLKLELGVVPRDEIGKLALACSTGEVQQFTVGSRLVGDFILKTMSETWKHIDRNGVLTCALLNLSLEEYT